MFLKLNHVIPLAIPDSYREKLKETLLPVFFPKRFKRKAVYYSLLIVDNRKTSLDTDNKTEQFCSQNGINYVNVYDMFFMCYQSLCKLVL